MFDLTEDCIQNLLGRRLDKAMLTLETVRERNILVTGAGGSIGRALADAVACLKPKTLVLYESSEFALYKIEQELRQWVKGVRIVPVLGNLTHTEELVRLLGSFQIDKVYHAAAYKHVPMVERNPIAGLRNNLYATRNLVQACGLAGIKDMMMVSTDKAVRPTNVMGASKRLAEYVTLAAGYRVVRFGNVLGSSGSVLPLFCNQLHAGKPVTITDKDVTRYFMSVNEAVGLILQSELTGGKISVFDMGVQVRIEDMARTLAAMMNKKLKIRYVGLRPGEKMYEELTLGENLQDTDHPHIKNAVEDVPTQSRLDDLLYSLMLACEGRDLGRIRVLLQENVPDYVPSCGIMDDVWLEENVINVDLTDDFKDTEAAG
jgi:FlaA1/EpsC-like NDP-sugar epimerase